MSITSLSAKFVLQVQEKGHIPKDDNCSLNKFLINVKINNKRHHHKTVNKEISDGEN